MNTPEIHRRRSLRLKDFDYSSPGLYFVTISTHEKQFLFGDVRNDRVNFSAAGLAVHQTWMVLPSRFPSIQLDAFVIMPNHVHGILIFNRTEKHKIKGAASSAPTTVSPHLGMVIRAFKSRSAIAVNRTLGRTAEPVWQRNYFEHVIRSGRGLDEIRQYIADNPLRWSFDRENPQSNRINHIPSTAATLDWLP